MIKKELIIYWSLLTILTILTIRLGKDKIEHKNTMQIINSSIQIVNNFTDNTLNVPESVVNAVDVINTASGLTVVRR